MAWVCEAPDHEGDRIVRNKLDRFSKRVTYVRADGKQRLNELTMPAAHRCRTCVEREDARHRSGDFDDTLF